MESPTDKNNDKDVQDQNLAPKSDQAFNDDDKETMDQKCCKCLPILHSFVVIGILSFVEFILAIIWTHMRKLLSLERLIIIQCKYRSFTINFAFLFQAQFSHIIGIVFSLVLIITSIYLAQSYYRKKYNRYLKYIRLASIVLSVFVIFFLIVRIASPPAFDTNICSYRKIYIYFCQKFIIIVILYIKYIFPNKCEAVEGCCRVALSHSNLNEDMVPPRFRTSRIALYNLVLKWVQDQGNSNILYEQNFLIRTTFISTFFGFLDDFGGKISCDGDMAVLQTQMELRFGKGDLGVNTRRTKQLLDYIYKHHSQLPQQACI